MSANDRSSEGHRVRVVIRLQTPSVSSGDTHSLELSEGERVVNGQAVSSDTSSAEFQAQLDEEIERELRGAVGSGQGEKTGYHGLRCSSRSHPPSSNKVCVEASVALQTLEMEEFGGSEKGGQDA